MCCKPMVRSAVFLVAVLFVGVPASFSAEDAMQTVTYRGIRPDDPSGKVGLRNPERGWRIQLPSSLPASVLTVSGVFLHRFFDVFERMIGVHERALDIFEKGLDLGDRFLDIFEKELDRAHRQAPPDSDLPDVPPPPEPTPSMDPTGDGDQEPATDVPGLRPPAPSEKRPGREEPTWRHESVEDPMTDRTRQVFWTQGRDVEGAAEDLRLDMWCDDGQARVFIHSNRFHGFESDTFDFGHATARIRLGDEAVRKIRGTLSDNSHSLEFPEGTQLAREMITTDAGELRVEVPTPFDGNLVGRFALNGLDDVIADKREMCLGGAD